jgi:hypothetical protein
MDMEENGVQNLLESSLKMKLEIIYFIQKRVSLVQIDKDCVK